MKTITATWFETKVRYDKQMEDGQIKKVTEAYVVDAVSFSEAETRITGDMASFVSGEFDVVAEKIAAYGEIMFSESETDDKWYKVKVQFIILDEKTGKEKRSNVYYLVQASCTDRAQRNMEEVLRNTMIDYVIASVVETPIIDVYRYHYQCQKQ